MDRLVAYIEENLGALVTDMVPALREVDALFGEVEPGQLARTVHQALWHFTIYVRRREPEHLDSMFTLLGGLWPSERFFVSALVRVLFGFEDLLAIRAGSRFDDADDFLDVLRLMRVGVREALCVSGDRLQTRYAVPVRRVHPTTETLDRESTPTAPLPGAALINRVARATQGGIGLVVDSGADPQDTPGRPADVDALVARLGRPRLLGRVAELQKMWGRLRVSASGSGTHHEVIGVKAPDGYGKSMLMRSFLERVEEHLGRAPLVLRVRAPRLFSLPLWPFADLMRAYFRAPLGDARLAEKVREGIKRLSGYLKGGTADRRRAALERSAVHVLNLLGDADATRRIEVLDPRAAGIGLRRALVAVVEAIAGEAVAETRAPLFIEIEDAGEMDGPSWELLIHLLDRIRPKARLMVLLSYGGRFFVPAALARYPGFTELILDQFDLAEGGALIDALLEPNRLDDASVFRLISSARGTPLLLVESTRQLVENGVIGLESGEGGQTWVEKGNLPGEAVLRDLAGLVGRRLEHLTSTCGEVLELVVVVEDAVGGSILEEVAARRALDRQELIGALERLQSLGFVNFRVDDTGIVARSRHALIRDQVYRQMSPDRRRLVHEDAGEVYQRLPGAAAFPSLAADHMALAGLRARALNALLSGVDRCVAIHNLFGGLELCNQALGLLEGLAQDDRDRFVFQVLCRRERVYGLLGQRESQRNDLARLESLAEKVANEAERAQLVDRRARFALLQGEHAQTEALLLPAVSRLERGTPAWMGAQLTLALNCWQQGQRAEGRAFLEDAMSRTHRRPGERLRGRLEHARARFDAGEGRLDEALGHFFEGWRAHRRAGDLYAEGLVTLDLGLWYWTRGRLVDAAQLLARARDVLDEADEGRARVRVRLLVGQLHARLGDLAVAEQSFGEVLDQIDRERHVLDYASATIGQGRVLVCRGRFDEAMGLLAQCLKDVDRRTMRQSVYVDALNALALTFATAARGERLVVGALSYAGEAADRATEIGHLRGLVEALGIQVRALLALDRAPEAGARLGDLEAALASAINEQPRYERLAAEVNLYRYRVATARGEHEIAAKAREAMAREIEAQVAPLRGTPYERPFLTRTLPNREIMAILEGGGATAEARS